MQGFPFDSQLTFDSDNLPVYDRAVSSQPLRKLIRDLFTTGVMPNPSTNLQVSSGTDGMTVQVQAGFAVVDGGLCQETETRTLEVTAADTTYDRIDTVVLRWNENVDARTADLYVVAGTPSATPVRPALQRDNSIYEIGLADIFITKRVATITDDKITDTRYESERCGIVSSVSEWDTTTIYKQIQADLAGFKANEEAEFVTWFDYMKDQLSEDAAGHLEQSKANLDGGNTFTGGNQTVQGKNINLQSTNITRGATLESNTWGDSRLNIVDSNGNRCAYIQPLQRATGEIDLRLEKDSNNSGGKILINGIDIEKLNNDLSDRTMYPDYTSGVVISSGTTISANGWVQLSGSSGATGLTLTINGTLLFNGGGNSGYTHYTFSPMLPVKAGDIVTCTGISPVLRYYSNR